MSYLGFEAQGCWYEHMLIVLQGSLEAFVDGPNSASLGRKGYGTYSLGFLCLRVFL